MIMEAEMFHDLPSAPWRPKEASGVVPVQTQMPENHKHQSPRAEEDGCSSTRKRANLPFCTFFVYSSPQLIE